VTITPLEYLEALSISKFDKNAVKDLQRKKENELVSSLPLRHGIEDLIKYAEKKNLKTGIVTGSSRNWVDSHLNRLKISDSFEIIISKEDTSKHKPAPDPYLLMADRLRVESEEILVIEDTPAGIQSAKKAGMRCIAYENSITKHLNLKMADMVFAELPEPNRIESLCAQIFMRQPER
jgi:HAD superfamily hydrolase (TIGR01509 family)